MPSGSEKNCDFRPDLALAFFSPVAVGKLISRPVLYKIDTSHMRL